MAPLVASFVIVTTGDLPEAYFLARFLESRAQRLAMLNVVARPMAEQLKVLKRLRRNRGNIYLADLLLAKVAHWAGGLVRRPHGHGAFPEVDAAFVRHIRSHHPHIDCTDPHAAHVLDFVRSTEPDYLLLAGAQILKPELYQLGREGALNRHLGLLPDMRGSDCPIWAFALNQPERSGYSIHRAVEKVDERGAGGGGGGGRPSGFGTSRPSVTTCAASSARAPRHSWTSSISCSRASGC